MTSGGPGTESRGPAGSAEVVGRSALAVVVMLTLAGGPWLVSNRVSPLLGLILALLAFPAWALLGPRRTSVVLFVLYLWGWAFVAAGFLVCLIRWAAKAVF